MAAMDSDTSAEVTYLRYGGNGCQQIEESVVREAPWTVHVNGQELVTLVCTPNKINFMALGFLAAEGLISSMEDVDLLRVCEEQEGVIDVTLADDRVPTPSRLVLLSGCGQGITFDDLSKSQPKLDSSLTVPRHTISSLMREFRRRPEVRNVPGGTHASALADTEVLLVVAVDVGRHNTLDKIRGECMFRSIPTADRILLTTGRISSEMVKKALKMQVPIIASLHSPTDLAVKLAKEWEATVIGYVRGDRMNIYTRPDRVTPD